MRFYIDYAFSFELGCGTYAVCDADKWGQLVAEFHSSEDADLFCQAKNAEEDK